MANMKTRPITMEEYNEIMEALSLGYAGHRPNHKVAFALYLEANLGIRISDIVRLTPKSFKKKDNRYCTDITEKKTGKNRTFTVPYEVMNEIHRYCDKFGIRDNQRIIPITERQVQKQLDFVCDYLELEDVSTHSFRKFFAMYIYVNNDYDIELVRELLQHSDISITEKYLDVGDKRREEALAKGVKTPNVDIF